MRTALIVRVAALVLVLAPVAWAQPALLPSRPLAPTGGTIELGARFADLQGDQARFERFRDISDGAFLDRFRYDRANDGWVFELGADHVGRRDQRYFAAFQRPTLNVSFEWDQIPQFISRDTRTPYSPDSAGALRLPDALQQGVQARQLSLADVAGEARLFDVQSRRDTATFSLVYSPTREVDVRFNLKTVRREGTMPWGAPLGSFNNLVELPAPIDTRTTDVRAQIEWGNAQGMLRVGYDGSWFDQHVQALVWDSALTFTDGTTSSQGRTALWPSNALQAVTAAGSYKLPAASYVTASVSVGGWRQDEPLLPFTINSAIRAIPLERQTAEGEARTVAMTYAVTSRPSRLVWLNARFRYYDFDNRTPRFFAHERVRQDEGNVLAGQESLPYSVTRHNLDLDASFTPLPFTAIKVGYGREQADRTFRIFEETTDNVVRASIDTTESRWVSARLIFERSARNGSHFEQEWLDEVGEQPDMRHFDIADRNRNRVSAVVQLTPVDAVGITASVAAGHDDYAESGFGLRDSKSRAYTFGVDVAPTGAIQGGVTYTRETYTALQNSRNASPGAQFIDPRRDWSIDSGDDVDTVTGSIDLLKPIPNVDLGFAYTYTRSRATYVYGLAAGSTLATPVQLPPVVNELQSATADLRYFLRSNVAVGFTYWYDRYVVDDFALGPSTIDRINLPGTLLLGYLYRPYRANSGWIRLIYLW